MAFDNWTPPSRLAGIARESAAYEIFVAVVHVELVVVYVRGVVDVVQDIQVAGIFLAQEDHHVHGDDEADVELNALVVALSDQILRVIDVRLVFEVLVLCVFYLFDSLL